MEEIGDSITFGSGSLETTLELTSIAGHLKNKIEAYFSNQDLTVYIPGRQVIIHQMPVDLRMVLITAGKSDPYKVFFRLTNRQFEIFLVRHPHQNSLNK